MSSNKFNTLEQMFVAVAEGVRPPERLSVSEAAEKYRWVSNPGSYVGPYSNDMTPYMVEPQNELNSMDYTAVIFVGPAQTGKTEMIINWLTHTAICDPADFTVLQTAQNTARDFAKRRIDRLFRHSKEVGKRRLPGRNNQNTFDTRFTSGMLLTLSWPSINELSGKPIPRMALTDYDRMPENVDGEGAPFDLARKRTTSFRRYGMTLAESTPGFEITNPRWRPATPHEAPPTAGILSLYNRGDRRRWYWQCPHCNDPFEPDFHLLSWPDSKDAMECAEKAVMVCPRCGGIITSDPETGNPGKFELNKSARWVKEGMLWMPDGSMAGAPIRTDIASFWMKGVCAAFTDWKNLVFNYLKAEEEYEKTGSQEALKTTVNTDQGHPYAPRGLHEGRLPEDLKTRARELPEKEVPEGVRFLIATVDVQKHRFVVQVHGFSEGGDLTVIDRYEIRKSERRDEDGERLWINPASEPEDWKLLTSEVIEKTYPLSDGSGRFMSIRAIGCDSAGREGVTVNAYNYWRHLRDEKPSDYSNRFMLLKGGTVKTAPRIHLSYPDSERKDRKAGARGEVPVLILNTDSLKDMVSSMLDRTGENLGRIILPRWLPDWFYSELVAETRTEKGWEQPKGVRNEAFDLLAYANAISLSRLVRIEHMDWTDPPGWADVWDNNDLVFLPQDKERPFAPEISDDDDLDMEDIANALS